MIFICTLFIAIVLSANTWVDPFFPLATFYVSPSATSGDGSIGSPFGFDQIGRGTPGNLYLALPGTYSKGMIIRNSLFFISCHYLLLFIF
jgi:hypothetical protein